MLGERSGDVNIPLDLTLEILNKLPAKSVVRFACVSKLWKTIIRDYIVKDSIVTRSLTHPPRDPHFIFERMRMHSSSSSATNSYAYSYYQTTHKEELLNLEDCYCVHEFQYVRGLIAYKSSSYLRQQLAIHNPTRRQSISLPYKDKAMGSFFFLFGYDPLTNQYKVVCVSRKYYSCQVYTLGDLENQWRNIPCGIEPHYSFDRAVCAVCINGVIYYKAAVTHTLGLVRFDVRFESFNHVQTPEQLLICLRDATLVDYQGKLGCICKDNLNMNLWVLENERQEWSKITYVDVLRDLPSFIKCVGITRPGGEMVFVRRSHMGNLEPKTVYYYDTKLKKSRRVEIITRMSSRERIFIVNVVTDHVENIMSLS